jgi:Fe-S cluster assembly protein SufB
VRLISSKKNEPEFMLEFRLRAYRHWLTMKMPEWAHLKIPVIDYQDHIYYSAPKQRLNSTALMKLTRNYSKHSTNLGIPLEEQKHLSGVLPLMQ